VPNTRSTAITQRRTTTWHDASVAAASAFGTRITTNGTFMNGVHMCGTGPRQITEQHRGMREFSALVGFESRAAGRANDQQQHQAASQEVPNRHGVNVRTMPLKLVALACAALAEGPFVKVSK